LAKGRFAKGRTLLAHAGRLTEARGSRCCASRSTKGVGLLRRLNIRTLDFHVKSIGMLVLAINDIFDGAIDIA
jgi:hypothetical protein